MTINYPGMTQNDPFIKTECLKMFTFMNGSEIGFNFKSHTCNVGGAHSPGVCSIFSFHRAVTNPFFSEEHKKFSTEDGHLTEIL